jgi:hypothetical protein
MVGRNLVFGGNIVMANIGGKNSWALLLLILAGVVLGGFLGYLARDISAVAWLNYGQEFGIGGSGGNGIVRLDLGVIVIRFGLTVKITIASIIGVILAIIIYRKL